MTGVALDICMMGFMAVDAAHHPGGNGGPGEFEPKHIAVTTLTGDLRRVVGRVSRFRALMYIASWKTPLR